MISRVSLSKVGQIHLDLIKFTTFNARFHEKYVNTRFVCIHAYFMIIPNKVMVLNNVNIFWGQGVHLTR